MNGDLPYNLVVEDSGAAGAQTSLAPQPHRGRRVVVDWAYAAWIVVVMLLFFRQFLAQMDLIRSALTRLNGLW